MKKLTLFITILLIAIPMLFSCKGTPEGTTAADELTEPEREVYTIIANGASDYTIIRADRIDAVPLASTIALRKALGEKYGVLLELDSDWSKDNKENNTVTTGAEIHEILIGDTNRAETRAVAEEHADMQSGYVIKAVNGKIVIWGTNSNTLAFAIDYFVANLLSEGELKIEEGFCYLWNLNGDDMPLTVIGAEYSLVYSSEDSDKVWNTSTKLANELKKLTGVAFEAKADNRITDKSGKEILVGNTDRPESQDAAKLLNYMDYTIRTYENKIVVLGGSYLATQNAVNVFTELLADGKLDTLEPGFVYDYDFDHLIADSIAFKIDSFVPVWANDFTPAAWLTDYEEKLYALTCPTGRMTADAHRGDVQNYPENSLEGILSAIMMGCDVIEIDVRLTKDNVMVLMHDASLKRTTNWSSKKGQNGLPVSDQVKDWTYEQLLELRLLYNGKATDYKIPTMYEAALLFAGRAQIHFDCKVDTIDKNSDVFLLAAETGSKESFFYYYGLDTMQSWLAMDKSDEEFSQFVTKVRNYMKKTGHALRKRNYELIAKYGDHAEGWKQQYAEGRKMVFTNKIYDFCRYISENEGPISLP